MFSLKSASPIMAETVPHPGESTELLDAFAAYDRQVILNNVKVGCWIGTVFMPVGMLLDYFVYPNELWFFLELRLLCSALIILFWAVIVTRFGGKHPRALGILLAMFPSFFISWMIAATDGANSPYYAGLNIVLLVIGFVLHWTLGESLVAVLAVLFMYVGACLIHRGGVVMSNLINNLYFLGLTGIIVVTGSAVHSRWRLREFILRFELDKQFKQLRDTEAQLVQTEKLASLGRMSAGIIHEINNPLNFVKTGLYAIKNKSRYLPAEQQGVFQETVKDVEDGIDRVRNIVTDLRGFTTHSDDDKDDISVTELVDASVKFVSHEWGTTVKLEKQLVPDLKVFANKNKLIQVCVNMLENSLDAMKGKTFENGEQPTLTIKGERNGQLATVTFHDNGPGIKPENLGKIFDPFFTTKDVGEGMGLGLSICYKIMQEYGGRILVKSDPGKYCEFTLEFPVKG
jgi:two-component system sensor histidine kinase PhcS